MDAWLKSCKKQFNQKLAEKRSDAVNQLFLELYDTVAFDEEKFRRGYKKFTCLKTCKQRPRKSRNFIITLYPHRYSQGGDIWHYF